MTGTLTWYARRLRRMSPQEVSDRTRDAMRRRAWVRRQVTDLATVDGPVPGLRGERTFVGVPAGTAAAVAPEARDAVVAAADALLAGDWSMLGTPRPDIADPDWFFDPVTGRRAPDTAYAFGIDHRDEATTGNVKAVWELSRHHHLTVLAAAWWLTGEERYAACVDRQLRSWWSANPFLTGVHWTSGIEIGVRLMSWVWVRRLLEGWHGVAALFEHHDLALRQIRWHQELLAAFPSRASSANNHLVAEAAGQLAAACAFGWFEESDAWRREAARLLEQSFADNTFASGVNRELATDYGRFVAELVVVAGVEADACGHPLSEASWARVVTCFDAAAALLDGSGRPARQGDGDEGRAVVLDDPERDPWGIMLAEGEQLVGRAAWWPRGTTSVAATVLAAMGAEHRQETGRPTAAPDDLADAGIRLLRSQPADGPEIWCRCDGGPHGFLSIAAHAHADALSVEVRHGGVEVLVDPGTYCYHGEPEWRRYFRSTLAHNTVEIAGTNQSTEGGPFMWTRHATSTVEPVVGRRRPVRSWTASHDGYRQLDPAVDHERSVSLDSAGRLLAVRDVVTGTGHEMRLAFHLGPQVEVELAGSTARLGWTAAEGDAVTASFELPAELSWSAYRGSTDPVLGWYSPGFGTKVPTTTLIGTGRLHGVLVLDSRLAFHDGRGDHA